MSQRQRLPAEAFEFYVGLGEGRSYHEVAQHFGVSKRAVTARAGVEDWQRRIGALQAAARARSDEQSAEALQEIHARHLEHQGELQAALFEVMNRRRMTALVAAVFNQAVTKGDTGAARLLFERLLGKARREPLASGMPGFPDGLDTPADVKQAANALLQRVADGSLSPEDAQKAAAIVEAARRAVETEDLEKRVRELEQHLKKEKGR